MKAEPLIQVVTFRITHRDDERVLKIAKANDWAKGHVLRRIFLEGIETLERKLNGKSNRG